MSLKTSILRSDSCDYSDAYIVVKGNIIVTNPDNEAYDKKLAFKNNVPFTSCLSETNKTPIDNIEDLVHAMSMYYLNERRKN